MENLRTIVLCPLINKDTIHGHVYHQINDEVIKKMYSVDVNTTYDDVVASVIGGASAASVLACEFALINPPEIYRDVVERALCDAGIIPVYPIVGVSNDGMVLHLGYKVSDTLPDPAACIQLADGYRQWLDANYAAISEDDLVYCPDPWRTYVHFISRKIFKKRSNQPTH